VRQLHEHQVNPVNDLLAISVIDEPGAGGANHRYVVQSGGDGPEGTPRVHCEVDFQDGPINEVGVNGVTNEALLAIVIDRMRSFQAGPFACRENALALTKLEEAQMWLLQRTRARMARGVEGTLKK
jgi:hypothetical protein